jgi:pyruvyltransferase
MALAKILPVRVPKRVVKRRTMDAYWWVGRPNWGDLLTPLLLKHYCDIEALWAPFPVATIVGVGSVLEHVPNGWSGRIVGSVKLHEESNLPISAEILALRGPLSAKGIRGDFAIGDLGLLANELVRVETKKYKLGLVPHWSDDQLAYDPRFLKYEPVVIDPRGDPLEVIHTIGECDKIVSSSLHGIILSDAFGIPRRFEYAPRLDVEGGTFKFRDYSESIRTPFEVGKLIMGHRQAIDDCKSSLYDVLRSLEP